MKVGRLVLLGALDLYRVAGIENWNREFVFIAREGVCPYLFLDEVVNFWCLECRRCAVAVAKRAFAWPMA